MLWTTGHVLSTEDRLEKRVANAYAQALKNAWWDRLMGVRPGKGKRDVFEWLLTTAQIYDLPKGTIVYDDLLTQSHEIIHKPRGAGLKIDRDQWEDDEFEFAQDWSSHIGGATALDPQYAVIDLISGGETQKGYDGKAFYAADHPVHPFDPSKGTYRTLVTQLDQMGGTGSGAPALTVESFALGVAHMKKFVMPNGKNRNVKPGLIVTGPALEKEALEITSAGFIGATENILRNYRIEPLVINEITDKSWFLAAAEGETPGLLPFIRSERRAYAMTSYDGLTQAELNRMNYLEWQLRGRYGHTYGHPYQMVKFKVT
jgi:phage major head subunit gpT-like protein